mgnify:CR=1
MFVQNCACQLVPFSVNRWVALDILSGGMDARLVNACQTTARRDAR